MSDNLTSLIFLVQADLGEQQRERFVASMSLRQVDMQGYTYLRVKQLFLDLFCSNATSTADPLIRRDKRTTFLVLDEGEYEEETGFWVMDQATQEEGFVSLFSETEFWVLGAKGGYTKRKIHGRKFRKEPQGNKCNKNSVLRVCPLAWLHNNGNNKLIHSNSGDHDQDGLDIRLADPEDTIHTSDKSKLRAIRSTL